MPAVYALGGGCNWSWVLYLVPGGVCSSGVYSLVRGYHLVMGVVPGLRGGLHGLGACNSFQGDVCTSSRGVYLVPVGCLILGGCLLWGVFALGDLYALGEWGVSVSQHALRQTPSWTEKQTPVKELPWAKFVAAGKYFCLDVGVGVCVANCVQSINSRIWLFQFETENS